MVFAITVVVSILLLLDSGLRFILLCLRYLRADLAANRQDNDDIAIPSYLVLIPARDEEQIIDRTVRGLRNLMGALSEGELWIVADQCTDATAAQAHVAGAQVAVRTSGPLGKGKALGWWFQHYEEVWKARDVVIVLDADSELNRRSLRQMLVAVANGSDAAQSSVCPKSESIDGRIAGYSELLTQRIDDEARRRCGWSVPLRGTGMVFRTSLFAEFAPRLCTLAEDLELSVMLAAQGTHVAFVPTATVLDPKPRGSGDAGRQRARWLHGQFQVMLRYRQEMLRGLMHGGVGTCLLLLSLMLRPKTLFIALRLLALGTVLWPFAAFGLLMDTAYFLAGIQTSENRRQYLWDTLALPRYGLVWLNGLAHAKDRKRWLRTVR